MLRRCACFVTYGKIVIAPWYDHKFTNDLIISGAVHRNFDDSLCVCVYSGMHFRSKEQSMVDCHLAPLIRWSPFICHKIRNGILSSFVVHGQIVFYSSSHTQTHSTYFIWNIINLYTHTQFLWSHMFTQFICCVLLANCIKCNIPWHENEYMSGCVCVCMEDKFICTQNFSIIYVYMHNNNIVIVKYL